MDHGKGKTSIPWGLVGLFVFLSAGIVLAGLLYYQFQVDAVYRQQREQLTAIADLQVAQIQRWREERTGDANLIMSQPLLGRHVQEFLRLPEAGQLKMELESWMKSLVDQYHYSSVFLLDGDGNIRLSVIDGHETVGNHVKKLLPSIGRKPEVTFLDLHTSDEAPYAHFGIISPLTRYRQHKKVVVGFVLLRLNPESFLFPLIQSWPTQSRSAETLLLKRDGNEIVYLNELRHRKGTANKLRFPVADASLPAAMAVRGIEGIVEGRDYRGIEVLAALRQVTGTPWYMVAKIDREEITAPHRAAAMTVGAFMLVLIVLTGTALGLWWRHRRAQHYREQFEAMVERDALKRHFEHLVKYANDIILLVDSEGRIREVNDQACRTYGYSRSELLRMKLHDLLAPELREELPAPFQKTVAEGGLLYETVHLSKDGSRIPLESSSRLIEVDGEKLYQSICRDIRERREAQLELQRLSQRNAAILAAVPDIIMEVNINKVYTWANRAGQDFFGSDVIGREASFYFVGEQSTYEQVSGIFEGMDETTYLESWQRRRDGEKRLLAWWCRALKDEKGNVYGALSSARDITEHRQAEEALRERETKLRKLASQVPGMLYQFERKPDGSYCVPYCSDQILDLFGCTPEDVQADFGPITKVIVPEDVKTVVDFIEQSAEKLTPWSCEYRVQLPGNPIRWMYGQSVPERQSDGSVLWHGFNTDITERKRAEVALRESEERFRATFDQAAVGIALAGDDGSWLKVNDKLCSILGYDRENLQTKSVQDITFSADLKEELDGIKQVKEGVIQSYVGECRYIGGSGDLVWVTVAVSAIRDEVGGIKRFIFVVEDISRRRHAEEAFQASYVRLQTINKIGRIINLSLSVDDVYDAMIEEMHHLVQFERSAIVLMNESSTRWLVAWQWTSGQPSIQRGEWRDIAGSVFECILAHPAPFYESIVGEKGDWPETELLRREGITSRAIIPLEIRGTIIGALTFGSKSPAMYGEGDEQLLRSLADQVALAVNNAELYRKASTYSKEMEKLVGERTAELEASNKELEAFAYSVSHDLRAPLRGIDGWSLALLEDNSSQLDGQGRTYLDRIRSESQRMGKLIDDLLQLSRVTRAEIKREPVDLSAIARIVAVRLEENCRGRRLEFTIQPGLTTMGDQRLLEIVMTNLLDNACKFTGSQPLALIEVGSAIVDGKAVFFVRDNGVGFDMKYAANLFGAFQRLHKQSEFPGTGIGLASVLRIIRRHGGEVWAQAAEGKGATFYFTLKD